jgi:hypothetical protein
MSTNQTTTFDPDLDGPTNTTSPTPTGKTSRRKESSFAAVLSDLEVGESACRPILLTPESTATTPYHETIKALKVKLHNNSRQAVETAMNRTGGKYRIESSETCTASGHIYVLLIVTRTV